MGHKSNQTAKLSQEKFERGVLLAFDAIHEQTNRVGYEIWTLSVQMNDLAEMLKKHFGWPHYQKVKKGNHGLDQTNSSAKSQVAPKPAGGNPKSQSAA